MGCDIHVYTERKRNINNVEKWVSCDHFTINPYYEPSNEDGEQEYNIVNIFNDRNYHLFSVLANVRNYSDNKFMSEPKGLPSDCGRVVKKESDRYDCDGHSHSYFTLKELKDFRKDNKVTRYTGMMSPENAKKVDNGEMPDSWCESTNIPSYVYKEWDFETDILKRLVELITDRQKTEFWIHDDEEHPDLDEKIRIVFFFDN